uniref:Uncharacterized protein n=1 Tax=Anguilla anguilla TaxID=7936 RepID=A0A0E9Q2U6_ANGAN
MQTSEQVYLMCLSEIEPVTLERLGNVCWFKPSPVLYVCVDNTCSPYLCNIGEHGRETVILLIRKTHNRLLPNILQYVQLGYRTKMSQSMSFVR